MKTNWNFSGIIGLSVALRLANCTLAAQVGPDFVWVTNAHYSAVTSIAFSGDSIKLASGSYDEHAMVWMVNSPTLVRSFYTFNEWILCVGLSSDGSFLATGSDEGVIRLSQVTEGTVQWETGGSENVIDSVAFSHDDRLVVEARGDNGVLLVHDRTIGEGILFDGEDPIPALHAAVFSPDDTLVASCGEDRTAKLWLVSNHLLLRTFIGHSNTVNSVEFSPDGTMLATAGDDGTARLWNVANGAVLRVIDGGGGRAKFSANGSLLLTLDLVNNGLFKIWRVSNGAFLGSYANTDARSFDIARNGQYFAYGRNDGALVLALMPVVIDSIVRTNNQTILTWQGGTGLYQLQRTSNLAMGPWENEGGPTPALAATNLVAGTYFYRVQSVPNP